MKVEIKGVKELDRKLKALSNSMQKSTVEKSLLAAAEPIRASASRKAPRRTGKLSQNIVKSVSTDAAMSVDVGPNKSAFYGRFVEFGTSNMSKKPFLRPAYDEGKGLAQSIFAAEIKRIIEGVR